MIPLPILLWVGFLGLGVGSFIGRRWMRPLTCSDREARLWEAWYYIWHIGQAAWACGLIVLTLAPGAPNPALWVAWHTATSNQHWYEKRLISYVEQHLDRLS